MEETGNLDREQWRENASWQRRW